LGVAISRGVARVLALASQYCVLNADVVGATRSPAGALGAESNDFIEAELEVLTSNGFTDCLRCVIPGGLKLLEKMLVQEQRAAVTEYPKDI